MALRCGKALSTHSYPSLLFLTRHGFFFLGKLLHKMYFLKKKAKKTPTTFKKSNNQKENCLLFVSTGEKPEQCSWLGARFTRTTLQEMDLSVSSWTQQGCLGLAKCGVLFKMVLLLVLMLEITHTLPVLKPEAPFSQSTAHALLRHTLK